MVVAQSLDPSGKFRRQDEVPLGTLTRLIERSRPIRGQLQTRKTVKLLSPVLQLILEPVLLQPVPLPMCILRVLNGQFRQRGWLTLAQRLIANRKLVPKYAHRPTVEDNMMRDNNQNVAIIALA